jgi:hypothetical protein
LEGPINQGLNRIAWDLRYEKFKLPDNPPPEVFMDQGPEVPPGEYTAHFATGQFEEKKAFQIKPDPRSLVSPNDRHKKLTAILRIGKRIEVVTEALERMNQVIQAAERVVEKAKTDQDPISLELDRYGGEIRRKLGALMNKLISQKGKRVYGDERVLEKLDFCYFSMNSSNDAPTEAQLKSLAQAESQLKEIVDAFNRFLEEDYSLFQEKIKSSKLTLWPIIKKIIIE